MGSFDLTAMEPIPWSEAFDAPGWLHQVKWDGVRMLLIADQGISLVNRRGHQRTAQYPELVDGCGRLPDGTVLDGEIVAFVNGRPSFHRVLQRDFASQPAAIRAKLATIPVSYLVFDLLYFRGNDVRQLPLLERQALLADVSSGHADSLHVVESFSSGPLLLAAVRQQGLEGIVAKQQQSPYLPGKRSAAWRKIKLFHEIWCLVGGYTRRQGQLSALLLGLLTEEQQLVYVGAAGSGLSSADWQAILPFLLAAESTEMPFLAPPEASKREVHWVKPGLAVRVSFMEWSPALRLRAPVIAGFQAADKVDCSFSGQGV